MLAGYLATGVATALGLRKTSYEAIPKLAALSAAFFTASLIHINIGPSSAHLLLNGLAGILLGIRIFPAALSALVLQMLFFSFGGISSLGVNTIDMALPGFLVYLAFSGTVRKAEPGIFLFIIGFCCGLTATFLSCLFTSGALVLCDTKYTGSALIIFTAHIPVMLIEGIVTGFALNFLKKVRPEIFKKDEIPS